MLSQREYDILTIGHTGAYLSQGGECAPEAGELIALHQAGYLKHVPAYRIRDGKPTFISRYVLTGAGTKAVLEFRRRGSR